MTLSTYCPTLALDRVSGVDYQPLQGR
jgi:hypothetical protein